MRRWHPFPLAVAGLAIVLASCGGQQFPQSAGTPTTLPPGTNRPAQGGPASGISRSGGSVTTSPANPTAGRPAPGAAPSSDARAWLLSSVRRTSMLGTARLALSMKLVGTGTETMSAAGTGVIDFVHKAESLSMRGNSNGEPVTLDVRLVGGTVYTRTSGDWVSAPATQASVSTPDAMNYLTYLQGVSSDVRVEGHEVLRGVDTTRYGADVDLGRALAQSVSPDQRKALSQGLAMLGGVKMPTTVWIDGDGRLRKMLLSMDISSIVRGPADAPSDDIKIVVVVELYDFGTPVDVVAPSGALSSAGIAQIRVVQSDLRNALVAEKVVYTDRQSYSADPAYMKQIESSLDWGNKMRVVVGAAGSVRGAVVCLSTTSTTGQAFSIADVAAGPDAGTYYGRSSCPAFVDDASMARLGPRW
jgi:hypothetical protein